MEVIKLNALVSITKNKRLENNVVVKAGTLGYVMDSKIGKNGQRIYLIDLCGLEEGCPIASFEESEIQLVHD